MTLKIHVCNHNHNALGKRTSTLAGNQL